MNKKLLSMIVLITSVSASSVPMIYGAPSTQPTQPAAAIGKPLPPVTTPPAIDATTGKGAVAPGAPASTVVREGTYIVDRTGRLNRSADGNWYEFTFDSDGKTMKDPPVVILPNLKLMQMESAVASASKDVRFLVTGMLTEYKSRNYILLEKVLVVPDTDQQF